MNRATNSVGQIGSALDWGWENLQFLRMRLAGLGSKAAALESMLVELDEYGALYERATGRSFHEARIFEVGYGARPLRLIALTSMGHDAKGIDLDAPMLERSTADLLRILRTNGFARFLKSSVRALVFDAHEQAALARALDRRGTVLRIDRRSFLVGDVAQVSLASNTVDFIYSEDVFEHIPSASLPAVCTSLARALTPEGIALISPSVFSGIRGGHLVEWYDASDQTKFRRSEPWEHLRKRRFVADCYLNELRPQEYRAIFESCFVVEEMTSLDRDLGRHFLTPEIRSELSEYTEEELLSDKWRFVLRKRT